MAAVSTDQESQKTAKKRGREKGCEKTGGSGCRKPPSGLKPAELRRWMIENTKVIENLLKMADGLPVQMRGPTGKQHWHYPEMADVRWAMDRVLKRCLPELSGLTLSSHSGPE